jgi:hypothetical protein
METSIIASSKTGAITHSKYRSEVLMMGGLSSSDLNPLDFSIWGYMLEFKKVIHRIWANMDLIRFLVRLTHQIYLRTTQRD